MVEPLAKRIARLGWHVQLHWPGDLIAQAFVRAAPERLVWGSDWPHPSEKDKPDDARLFDLLAEWAMDEKTRARILVANPEALYGFAPGA